MTDLFITLLDMSLKGSFVILTVYLIRWWFTLFRYPRRFSYLLWGIVLLRLLLPVSIASPLSRMPRELAQGIALKWSDDYVGENRFIHDVSPDFDTAVHHGNTPITTNEGGQYVVTGPDGISPPSTVKTEYLPTLSALWLGGMAVMLLWNALALLRLRRQLKEAIPIGDNVWICDRIDTAFVVGLLRPHIYLPSDRSDTEQAHILRHERYHIRSCDHLWKLAAFAALCLHWFNPLVWMAYKLAMDDMELRCDEAVTEGLDEAEKADYAQTLLDMTTGHRRFQIAPVAFGEGDTVNRVRHVLGSRNTTKLCAALAVCILLITALGLLTDPRDRDLPFGASMYGCERIAYEDRDSRYGNPPYSFCLTTDMVFWARGESSGWQELGTAEEWSVTAEEMNAMMRYRLAMKNPPPITEVTDARLVPLTAAQEPQLFFLLTRHRDGQYYIAYGECESQSFSPEHMTIRALFPVKTGIGELSSNGPFYSRCLESMLGEPVDTFSTYHARDGWQIVGFRMGQSKATYGWAVFRIENNMATFTGQLELFEDSAQNNGILLSGPALANDTGEITDKTAYDVILISNPDIAALHVVTENETQVFPALQAPAMVAVPWSSLRDDLISYRFYNEAGEPVPDRDG